AVRLEVGARSDTGVDTAVPVDHDHGHGNPGGRGADRRAAGEQEAGEGIGGGDIEIAAGVHDAGNARLRDRVIRRVEDDDDHGAVDGGVRGRAADVEGELVEVLGR